MALCPPCVGVSMDEEEGVGVGWGLGVSGASAPGEGVTEALGCVLTVAEVKLERESSTAVPVEEGDAEGIGNAVTEVVSESVSVPAGEGEDVLPGSPAT